MLLEIERGEISLKTLLVCVKMMCLRAQLNWNIMCNVDTPRFEKTVMV